MQPTAPADRSGYEWLLDLVAAVAILLHLGAAVVVAGLVGLGIALSGDVSGGVPGAFALGAGWILVLAAAAALWSRRSWLVAVVPLVTAVWLAHVGDFVQVTVHFGP